jgi:hypothetical protein
MRPPLRPTTDQDSVCSTRPWSRSVRLLMITGGALSLLTISDAFIYLALQRQHHPLVRGTRCAGQGARRILSSRRGARLLVGPGSRAAVRCNRGDTDRRRDMRHCTNAACVRVPDDAADPSPMTATSSNDTPKTPPASWRDPLRRRRSGQAVGWSLAEILGKPGHRRARRGSRCPARLSGAGTLDPYRIRARNGVTALRAVISLPSQE